MFQKPVFLLFLFNLGFGFAQQKQAITHDDYDLWKSISEVHTSDDGKLIATTVVTSTGRGDGYLQIYNSATGTNSRFHNGYKTQISKDGNYIFFLRKPDYEVVRKEKKKDVKKEKMSKDMFIIYDVRKNSLMDSVSRVKGFKAPEEETGWVVIEKYKDLKPEKDTASGEKKPADTIKAKKKKNPALEADYGLVYTLGLKRTDTIFNLKSFELPKKGRSFYFTTTNGEKKRDIGLFRFDLSNYQQQVIDTGRFAYDKLTAGGKQLAFISARDSAQADSLKYELFLLREGVLSQVTDTLGKNLRTNWKLSSAQSPYFSENNERLFFFSRPVRNFSIDSTLLKDEIPQVDVWHYKDKLIQPEQKARLKELENRAYISLYTPASGKVVQLHDETLDYLEQDQKKEQRYILAYTTTPYDVSRSWFYPWLKDYYIVDTEDGSRRLALEETSASPYLAPDGIHAVYYDNDSRDWWVLNLQNNQTRNLTDGVPVAFYDVEQDLPAEPNPYGFGGFTKEGEALLFDQFDIWSASLGKTEAPRNITSTGRQNNIEYRSLRLDPKDRNLAGYLDGKLLLNAFDKTSKTGSLHSLNLRTLRKEAIITAGDMILSGFEKPENAEILAYRKQNFRNYPDLYLYRSKRRPAEKITGVNPQQKDFKWGTSELFSWTSYDGIPLEGIVYKPDNFDPSKKYPLMTYFYERRSDNLHNYHSPQPSASTVNMSYLVSNDYLVFVPDIVYKEGKPGQSAYNSIVAGVEALEKEGFVDSDNMAIQGQSWGGYQVAHLVTVTNKFKAAMAGAPVANMTSAYGGIRWQSGLSRAFQYEKTQSRIGKTLWEGLDLYLENSPLFSIPAIETPLLMMHNDDDGAVPYYQGIEMFMGMRRLNKPVWLLVYNDEAHNLRQVKNKQDLSIRMMQFFDHYLKGAPAPVWMTEGLPAVKKGKDLGYELEQD